MTRKHLDIGGDTTNSQLHDLSLLEGAPAVDVRSAVIPASVLALVPEDFARSKLVLPLRLQEQSLFVATRTPNSLSLLDEISFVTGRRVVAYVAPRSDLESCIQQAYAAISAGRREWRGPNASVPTGGSPNTGLFSIVAPLPNKPTGFDRESPTTNLAAPPPPGITRSQPNLHPPLPPQAHDTAPDHRSLPEQSAAPEVVLGYVNDPPTGSHNLDDEPGPFDEPYPTGVEPIPSGERPRVLVIDDEQAIRTILKHALTQRGFDISEAANGAETLKIVKETAFDAILLDAMLPDIHGFEIARRLKESPRYANVPIMIMTAVYKGWRMAADLRESYGVANVIEKPFEIQKVADLLQAAIAGRPVQQAETPNLSREAKRAYVEASAAYKRGDIDTAITGMRRASALDPLSAHLRLQLALLLAMRGQDFPAITELETAIELEPDSLQALKNLASLYQRKGFRRKASELYERALNVAHATNQEPRVCRDLERLIAKLMKTPDPA